MPYTATYTKTVTYSEAGTQNNLFSQSDTSYTNVTGGIKKSLNINIPLATDYTGIHFSVDVDKLMLLSFNSNAGTLLVTGNGWSNGFSLSSDNQRTCIFARTGNNQFESSSNLKLEDLDNTNLKVAPSNTNWTFRITPISQTQVINLNIESISNENATLIGSQGA